MTLKEQIQNKTQIHTRTLSLVTYPLEGPEIIVEGRLKDERLQTVFDISGEILDPGTIHQLVIRLLIRDNPLRIAEAEGEMIQVPMEQCLETLDLIKKIPGLKIKAGFSKQVKDLLGGTQGCAHLAHLLTVMGQEIVHGWLTHKRKNKNPVPKSIAEIKETRFLLNSCRMWTEDGPKIKQLVHAIEKQV